MTISEFFKENNKVAIAFSGGVDSAFLLREAVKNNADVTAYYVKTQFQPRFEYDDALRLGSELDCRLKVLELDVLSDKNVALNPANRCYFCKQRIFAAILEAAKEDGYSVVLDGTNASDEEGDRPGMKALRELKVRSPLRECGLTKPEIRCLSKEAGLFTWDKPAYACLATRIKTGERLTEEKLKAAEASEEFLFGLGFSDFRVRRVGDTAKIQIKEDQLEKFISHRAEILGELKMYYDFVTLDLSFRV